MDKTKTLAAIIGAAPPVIAGLLAVAFPWLALYLLVAVVVVWVAAVMLWQFSRIQELQSKVSKLEERASAQPRRTSPLAANPTPVSDGWKTLEAIELFLDDRKVTKTHRLTKGTTIRLTVNGPKRFHARLATDLKFYERGPEAMLRGWSTVYEFSETKSLEQIYNIDADDDYAVVVERIGESAFWVAVKIEQDVKSPP
jgi:hypothetical protein